MFSWMVWTTPVAVFFISIAVMLVGMTMWETRAPTMERKGFLPIATTRGGAETPPIERRGAERSTRRVRRGSRPGGTTGERHQYIVQGSIGYCGS